jgi:hypothetical protein
MPLRLPTHRQPPGGYNRQSRPNVWERYQSPKFFHRNEDMWTSRLKRTPNGFGVHEVPRPNENSRFSKRIPNILYFHYVWLTLVGVISIAQLHMTSCLAPMWEGVPNYAYTKVGFKRSLVFYGYFLWSWRVYSLVLDQRP